MPRKSISLLAIIAATASAGAQTRPHNFKLQDVHWSVSLDDANVSLTGDVTNTLRPVAGAKQIALDFGNLTVDSVTVDGIDATFRHEGESLTVDLPAQGDGARSVAIRVRYHGKPKAGAYFVPAARAYPAHTPVVYTQGEMVDNRYWLPTYDYPDDKATSEGIIEVPEGWYALSNGKLLEKTTSAGRTKFHWKMDKPHATYLISFVAGPYEEGKGQWEDIPVNYYVPNGLLDQGQATFGFTPDVVKFYSKLTGFRYPWVKYTQSAVPDFMFGGMENVTCTTQTIEALHPKSVEPLQDSLGLVAHELAHQWFGDTITCNGWSDAWINEGWATFLPPFYERETRGPEAFDISRYGIFEGGLEAHRENPNRPVVWKGYRNALDMFDNFIYPGGASRMFMLMHSLGEERFWKATQAYLEERKYTSFDTAAFFDSYSRATGKDLKPFMKQWFFTSGCPNLTVSEKGNELVVKQTQPTFDLDLPVWVLNSGVWIKRQMKLHNETETLDLGHLAGMPVLVDPECWIMANVDNKVPLTFEERVALFEHAPNSAEKLRIIDRMLGDLSPEQLLTFARKIESRRVLEHFIPRLQDGSQAFLIELSKSPDRLLADAAIQHLGGLPANDAVKTRLREIYASDPNVAMREHAARGLLDATNDATLADELWKKDGVHDLFRQIALTWWSRKNPDVARERCLEAIDNQLPEPTRVHAIDLLGTLKDKKGERRVYEALTAILGEQSFGARSSAIVSLASYGDPKAIPLIEPYEKAELVFFRYAAERTLATLRAMKQP